MGDEISTNERIKVIGYHGTMQQSVDSILRGDFILSRNEYDWLGDGVYFFQEAPVRAWEWAKARYGSDAAVIGSSILLEDCIDLLDIEWSKVLANIYDAFLTQLKRAGLPLPRQTSGAHRLDRDVINYAVGILAEQGISVRSLRAAFIEGVPIFPQSALFDRAHVQIAVRDTMVIEQSWVIEKQGELIDGNSR